MAHIAPYGSWQSPLTSDQVVAGAVTFGPLRLVGDATYWTETRPDEGGRTTLIRCDREGTLSEVTPAPAHVRTRAHEYGGLSYAVAADGTLYYSEFTNQRVYRLSPGGQSEPITPHLPLRYADYELDARRQRLYCVREDHRVAPRQAISTIVSLSVRPGAPRRGTVLAGGNDFYSSPRLSPDGRSLAYLTWNHPNMPWDGCELWVATLDEAGAVTARALIAGGKDESIFQPEWSPDGALYFTSDRTGWWNLYRWRAGVVTPLHPAEAEFGKPGWSFGMSAYAFAGPDRILCAWQAKGHARLGLLDTRTGALQALYLPWTVFFQVQAADECAVFMATSPTEPPTIVQMDVASRATRVLRRAYALPMDPAFISVARHMEYPTAGERMAYGYFFPPKNPAYAGPPAERPPVIVMVHGGPTSATSDELDLSIQYWTTRGFAVFDVDYSGSSGYGRAYRERLHGQWGIADVADCVHAVRYLAERGLVDGSRAAITGGSAGGYTTLAALAFSPGAFRAGVCLFGVSDLEALARETHKFESRYLDRLVAPYPEGAEIYKARSPIYRASQITDPLLVFQGLDDKVVPPAQAEVIVESLRARKVPVAYLAFAGEGHGFRGKAALKRTLEATHDFYARVFGFPAPEDVEPAPIEHLSERGAHA
ncbi:MAG TPA: prolyl oligopeptidase family serine peptidase [Ktedonobacterales bacterium]